VPPRFLAKGLYLFILIFLKIQLDLFFSELHNDFVNNFAFSKAVRLLVHPLSLGAIGLMLANDFILKPLWPSWWTGKLSDFAGLFFLPFLLAALFSLAAPARLRLAGWLAFGVTGLGFSLLKLDPVINAALLSAAHTITGLSFQARLDPSDLLALLSLLPAAWLWRKNGQPSAAPALKWRLALVLPLAALVTLADAAAPDLGVACLQVQASGGAILASTRYLAQTYQTLDGGFTWQLLENQSPAICGNSVSPLTTFKSQAEGDVLYRFNPGQGIDRSEDGGLNWRTDYGLSPLTEPEQAYLKLTRSGNIQFGSSPYAAAVDPASGNLILAMGLDGVLVRRSAGNWTWATVGPYQHDSLKLAGAGGLLVLLQFQLYLAILAGLGWLFTRSARLMGSRAARMWTILGWIALGVLSLLVAPDIVTASYGAVSTFIGLGVMAVATLVALLVALIRLKGRFFRMLLSGLPQAMLLAAACLLPYVLWGVQVIPGYGMALAASTGLVVLLFILFSLRKKAELA